jgi:paraquat-inducible protein A
MSCSGFRAAEQGLVGCHLCGLVVRAKAGHGWYCPRCGSALHFRKPNSIGRSWALLITAMIMYIPANALPVMHTTSLGNTQGDTILSGIVYFLKHGDSGIVYFLKHGDWPLALIIFVASVMVPLLKMIALGYLLISVQRHSLIRHRQRTLLYRITELVGRWSMVDVFVVALMVALVHLGNLAEINPGFGALAFSAVVILTMVAAMSFDPRLIWDHQEQLKDHD